MNSLTDSGKIQDAFLIKPFIRIVVRKEER